MFKIRTHFKSSEQKHCDWGHVHTFEYFKTLKLISKKKFPHRPVVSLSVLGVFFSCYIHREQGKGGGGVKICSDIGWMDFVPWKQIINRGKASARYKNFQTLSIFLSWTNECVMTEAKEVNKMAEMFINVHRKLPHWQTPLKFSISQLIFLYLSKMSIVPIEQYNLF
jgi:hypothetical protein